MLKAAIVACALCAGGTAFWVKSASHTAGSRPVVAAGDLMAIQQLQSKTPMKDLPVFVLPEPY